MDRSIFKFVFRYSKKQQIYILFVTAISLPFYYFSLDIPKRIVNQTLGAESWQFSTSYEFFLFPPVMLERLELLFALCGAFLLLVLINGGFKYYINVYKGRLGERMLRRLRYQLLTRILRFPLRHFHKVSQGELIPMVTAEIEPVGGFIGDALALPAHQGGLLITAIVFIFAQDMWMGLAAVSLYPIQGYIIPKLQRQVVQLGKIRVREVRKLSERIGEGVTGAQDIHAHDTSNYELADFAYRLGRIYDIRYKIYRKKFFVKFLNNFLGQLTPFFFFSIGGYLVIEGAFSLGSLVAVLAAYKDLGPPWKELLNYYQIMADTTVKYEQVVNQFEPEGMLDESLLTTDVENPRPLEGEIVAINLGLTEDDLNLVESVSFSLGLKKHVAIAGAGGSGKEALSLLMARLADPTSGKIRIAGQDIATLPEAVTGRRISYIGPNAFLRSTSLGDNLFYGLKHRPQVPATYDDATASARRRDLAESLASGNTTLDLFADWTDYAALDASSAEELKAAGVRALHLADLSEDVYNLGLRSVFDPVERPEITQRLLAARAALRERLADPEIADLVEPFDVEKYNHNMTLAENLLFGTPLGKFFDIENLGDNPYVESILKRTGLIEPLMLKGYEVAATMVELFSGLPPEHEFFEQFSFIGAEDLPDYGALIGRANREKLHELEEADRVKLLSLPFKLIPARHRLGIIDEEFQERLLEARAAFAANLPDRALKAVEFFHPDRYNAAATVQDNILFGKVAYGHARGDERVGRVISEVLDSLGLRADVIETGMDFQVGIGGTRLSVALRQKLALARAVLKRPDILIVSEATAALDGNVQIRIMDSLLGEFRGRSVIWVLHRPSLGKRFDRILVMRNGRLVEQGSFTELDRPGSDFRELIADE